MPPSTRTAGQLQVLSVGIDVGSSTSHLVFSRLTLAREFSFTNPTNQFQVIRRDILYQGQIIFTPLLDSHTIDLKHLIAFFEQEYERAGITPEMVETGAVIVTGETAKKDNAAEIVNQLSSQAGKFVSATAGPNFEAMLGIMGSGIVERSKATHQTLMNVDIGGGTSNIAIVSNGTVVSTACINVGGRLLGIRPDCTIWRIDDPTRGVMAHLGLHYDIGDVILEDEVKRIAQVYAEALLEVMRGPATTPIAQQLMMTANIDSSHTVDHYSFSGGVAELLYPFQVSAEQTPLPTEINPYHDIGGYLAQAIHSLLIEHQLSLIEPKNKIRATVIGAGAFSLSISGSTCYADPSLELPLNNLPVVPLKLNYTQFVFDGSEVYLKEIIDQALRNFNLIEGEDLFALYFEDFVNQSALIPLAKALAYSFPHSIQTNHPIVLILEKDGGKVLGLTLKRETAIRQNLLCLDELMLAAGDWVDIGTPLNSGRNLVFPVTKKSLIFHK